MAGEYGVRAELSKRGFDANITLGNEKATVVMIFQEDKSLRRMEVQESLFFKRITMNNELTPYKHKRNKT